MSTSSRPASRSSSSVGVESGIQINLRDCEDLIRERVVGLPGGFTKSGHPLLVFPDTYRFNEVLESDLHLLLKYYISVVPKTEQAPGFAIVIDRRNGTWQEIQTVFSKIISLFPSKIKQVFLLYQYPSGKPVLGQLVDDYLLDFDIFHVSHVTELLHYIDSKYLTSDLGGSNSSDVDTWLLVQQNVDSFTQSSTKIARRLATFVKILNQEDISKHHNHDSIQEVAQKNRSCYRRLRSELEDLTEQGVSMLRNFQEEGANLMQRLAVQMLCYQLDNTWQYFTRTFKMQDHLYVQYVELNQFQIEFRELSNKFIENEKIIQKLAICGSCLEEVTDELNKLESVMEALSVDTAKAKRLSKAGNELILEHAFARDSLEPKCAELRIMCKRQEILFTDKRRALMKFLDLYESLDNMTKWCSTASQHLSRDEDMDRPGEGDTLSQIRQIDYLMSRSRDIKIKSRLEFEEDFDEIKELIAAKTLFVVDDKIAQLEEIKRAVIERREVLREKAAKDPTISINCENTDDLYSRREKILDELLSTEERYVEDLHSVLIGYRDKMEQSTDDIRLKVEFVFGNMEEIYQFHSQCLLPELVNCGESAQSIARTFIEYSEHLNRLYCRYCQNMEVARVAVSDVGENHPLILSCQRDLGHQLPLSSYLLKPVQRLTKYQLLLKELSESCSNSMGGRFELEESLESILRVIKLVNDSLHQINIKGLPEVLQPLGSLIFQESFAVLTENKSQSQILFRNKQARRQVLLYEGQLIICKQMTNKTDKLTNYQFKFSLPVINMGMSSIIKGEEKKMEIWLTGQSDVYTLEARNKKAKEDFATELRKAIIREKENSNKRLSRISNSMMHNETMSTTSGSESLRSRRSHLSRSRSLEHEGSRGKHRSRSLDPFHDRSSSEAELVEDSNSCYPKYQVLADYMALTGRELNLHQGDGVELIKIGCAGWWYVRLSFYPFTEGWAPSTYLEKLPEKNRTLDRR